MKKILVVEDSSTVTQALRRVIEQESGFNGSYASTYAETACRLAEDREHIVAALVDLNLPDASDGEVVDYVLSLGIPTIVLTGNFDESKRKELLRRGIVDYVCKEGLYSFQYAVNLVDRIYRNQFIKVLVVDDSEVSRRYISDLLKLYLFQVYTAKDGIEALEMMSQLPDIKLLITDYNMPRMDGFALVQNLRNKHQKSELGIIGLSSAEQESLSAKFIKNGANDFLRKPFNREELQCRVMHNIEAIEHVEQIRDLANRDYLTGAYNRRYFFSVAEARYQKAKTETGLLALAVVDIDWFKKINDHYGHDVGDAILVAFARSLHIFFKRFLVARIGGEEFFVLMPGLSNEQACLLIDKARRLIGSTPVEVDGARIQISFSAGVSSNLHNSLDELIKSADLFLYQAKDAGRDCVIGERSYPGLDVPVAEGEAKAEAEPGLIIA